tara:strand:+ start:726 stop:1637 length:912 start_codon:yes stop_codon:yes gene_type:complete
MSNILSQILDRGLSCNSKLLLPEKSDERIKKATVQLNSLGYNVIDIDDYNYNYDNYLEMLSKMKFCKNWPYLEIKKYLSDPINYGLMMVANNDADGLVAGATVSTADIIKKAIRIIGVSNSAKCVSSIFFMISQDKKKYFTYSDCGVIPEPDSVQLSDIAYNASKFHKLLSNEEPRVAFLSFSTKGSAKHYRVERVVEAVKLFGKKYGDILHDGELQFDAAIDSSIAKLKAPSSNLGGDSNVFIFPNLDSGNIAYKITQRIGGYMALGPLLQGLNKPVHDLSRGCNVEDIVLISAIAALQKNI